MPNAPDYQALSQQDYASNKAATDAQTAANRPNQVDQYGNTLTWTQDPTTGQWSQQTSYGEQGQQLQNQQNALTNGLMGQAGAAMGSPLDMNGLQGYSNYDPSKLQGVNTDLQSGTGAMGMLRGGYGDLGSVSGAGQFNMDPVGNSKAIQDATYGLLGPQREMARNAEIQRLKNQGLTEDSPAFQRAVQRLDQGDTDAQLKSLLAGTTEYGNQFARASGQNQQNFGQNLQKGQFDSQNQNQRYAQDLGQAQFGSANQQQAFGQNQNQSALALALRGQQQGEQTQQNQQNMAMRDQQLKEALTGRQQPLSELTSLMNLRSQNTPEFSKFATASNAGGTDSTKAAGMDYNAAMSNYNAEQASKLQNQNALMSILGQLGTSASTPGTPANDAYKVVLDMLKGLTGGGNSDPTKNYTPPEDYPVDSGNGDPYNPD
jgi:hypothetical protein